MTEYYKKPIKIERFTSDELSPKRKKIQLWLDPKNNRSGMILYLKNIYHLPNSPCNLVGLKLLNNSKIFYNNQNEILYQLRSKKVSAQI